MTYILALFSALLVGAGYVLGSRRAKTRNAGALQAALEEQAEKLTLVEHELLRHTARDPATGLHMQEYFQEFLENEWRRASRQRHSVAVIMLEIDHFRALTERLGQREGDASLKLAADALKRMIHRPSDAIARYGGVGTFGIVLGSTDSKGAMIIAERLRLTVETLRYPNPASPVHPYLTASLGIAAATPEREAAWQDIELIASAERALALACDSGRNTVILDTPGSNVRL